MSTRYQPKRVAWWVLLNASIGALIYQGFYNEAQGPRNIVAAYIVLQAVLSLALFSSQLRASLREKGRRVPAWINATAAVTFVVALLWVGSFVLGGLLIFVYLMHDIAFSEPAAGSAGAKAGSDTHV